MRCPSSNFLASGTSGLTHSVSFKMTKTLRCANLIRWQRSTRPHGALTVTPGFRYFYIYTLNYGGGTDAPELRATGLNLIDIIPSYLGFDIATWIKTKRTEASTKFVFGSRLKKNELGLAIFRDFLPEAVSKALYIVASEPQVVGTGP